MSGKTARLTLSPVAAAVRAVLRQSIVLGSLGVAGMSSAVAVELPVPCATGSCGSTGPGTFVTSGTATYSVSGNTGTITQTSETATLNWSGFNISADGRVVFAQPSTTSVALNRIFQQSPSQIFGSLSTRLLANESQPGGSVYLVNPNGLVFGNTARVNAAGILASTLGISDETFASGLLGAVQNLRPALEAEAGADPQARIRIEAGAEIATTVANGRVLLAAQGIENAGKVRADDGQVILAAGDSVYLAASDDPSLRGLVVEVGTGGTAWNQLSGSLEAARGNVTVVGLAVNQEGRVSATTSVNAGGSVRLVAQDGARVTADSSTNTLKYRLDALNAGTLTLGGGSRTEIRSETESLATAVRDQTQELSSITLAGRSVTLRGGALVQAAGGVVDISAATVPGQIGVAEPDARIVVESGAQIDVAGNSATRSVADNIVTVELRGSELADDPQQRNGALRGATVTIDARAGTGIGNVSGAVASIQETVAQRTSQGGRVALRSNGSVLVADGATIDVSGGTTTYTGAIVNTTQLIRADGQLVNMRDADPEATYIGVTNPVTTIKHDRWGVVERILSQGSGHFEEGYFEGSSAGSVEIDARTIALNGTLLGQAVNGSYQRNRAATNHALGGRLVVGAAEPIANSYRAPDIRFTAVAPVLDVTQGPVPGSPLLLPTQYLTTGGFQRTELYSDGTVVLPEGVDLELLPGSTLTVRAGQIDILDDIHAPAGTLDFRSVATALSPGTGISVGAGVTLDVGGLWINDLEMVSRELPMAPLFQDAGSISLAATTPGSVLDMADAVQLLADGGAWISRGQRVTGGEGGDISLRSEGGNSGFRLGSGVTLQAFGVNGAQGGSFELAAARIAIGNDTVWANAQEYVPVPGDASTFFSVGSALFSNYGFQDFSIVATGGTLAAEGDSMRVLDGTRIEAVVANRLLSAEFFSAPSGSDIGAFSTIGTLPLFQRNAATIELRVEPNSGIPQRYGDLTVGAAVIAADPGSVIRLASQGGSIELAGELRAPGGRVAIELMPPVDSIANATGFDPELGIRLLEGAVIDVAGTSILTPNAAGLLAGEVLDGGSASLVADRGYLQIAQGARIDASGTAGTFDVATGRIHQPYVRQQVASNAGSIELVAAEAIDLAGTLAAHAGIGDTGEAAGGSLTFRLTRQNSLPPNSAPPGTEFPATPRVVQLTALPGSGLANGVATLSTSQVIAAGIDYLDVAADDEISVAAGLNLSLRQGLLLEAPVLSTTGADAVRLSAPYVLIGDANAASGTPVGGPGNLEVNAGFIDLRGLLALRNFSSAVFSSSGDIRFRGVSQGNQLVGGLAVQSDVTLRAAQVYAATGTQYTLDGPAHRVTIEQQGARPAAPLSAASSLTVNAREIVQAGTLVAPFGSIVLNGSESVTLADGSLTSVSAAGLVVPYGETTTGGKGWIYRSDAVTDVPERRIAISGDTVVMAEGATVDVSGGGDLHAFEFIKGTGGSVDALAASRGDLFAILPRQGSSFGPFDDAEYSGSSLRVGDTVYLSGGAGLAAGYYALLPARYALLPGAMLVSSTGIEDMLPGTQSALLDGTPVVAGYRSFADTGLGGTRYEGFAVFPGSWGRELAEYLDTYASTYQHFANAGRQVADAGALSLLPASQLQALSAVRAAGAEGGRNALIDISATNLRIVSQVVNDGSGGVQLEDSALSSWNAGSLLIGGTRLAGGSQIAPAATSVIVAAGVELAADEVILVGRESVTVDGRVTTLAGSSTTGLTSRSITLAGTGASGAAVVAVSDLNGIDILRATESGIFQGTVTVAGELHTRNGLTVDSPGGASLSGTLGGEGAEWNLHANHVVFDVASLPGQLTVTPDVIAAMESAASVRIASPGDLDFMHGTGLGSGGLIDTLTLSAARLRNLSAAGTMQFRANSIVLEGAGAGEIIPTEVNGGVLVLNAGRVGVVGQSLAVSGFAAVQIAANQQLEVRDAGKLLVGGDLDVGATRITMGSGSNGLLAASGAVALNGTGLVPGAGLPPLELGGGLSVRGTDVAMNADLVAPSGSVVLEAAQSLSVGGTIDVSGATVFAAGVPADSPGGSIRLAAGDAIQVGGDAVLAVNGKGEQAAGRMQLVAGGGVSFAGSAFGSSAGTGGLFELSAGHLDDFANLSHRLQVGGFTGAQRIQVAQGDLTLAAGSVITAHDVELVTGAGIVTVAGVINAPSTREQSVIRLYGTSVVLDQSGALHADATTGSTRGGLIELGAGTGTLDLRGGSITTEGAQRGRLNLRAASVGIDEIAIDALSADLTHAGLITLEAVLPVFSLTTAPTGTDYDSMRTAADTYMAVAEGVIAARLDPAGTLGYQLVPGIEIHSAGDLTLPGLDMAGWRFGTGATPAALTVRSTGALTLSGILSDGFITTGSGATVLTGTPHMPDRSATLRLVAGADLANPDPLGIGNTLASLSIDANGIVRTGGDLSLVASGDVVFGNGASVYTAGTPALPPAELARPTSQASMSFIHDGGRLSIAAGRDVMGAKVQKSVTAWQRRELVNDDAVDPNGDSDSDNLTEWGIDLRQFTWNAGTLGGGDLVVEAGRDIQALSAAVAESAAENPDSGAIDYYGGGALRVSAGNDIGGGLFYVGRNTGSFQAGRSITTNSAWTNSSGAALGVFLAMGESQVAMYGRTGITLAGAVNPTIFGQDIAGRQAYFFTYGETASIDLTAAAGNIAVQQGNTSVTPFFGTATVNATSSGILPPSVALRALSGDILSSMNANLFPSNGGNLELFAAGSIRDFKLLMSDMPASAVATPLNPNSVNTRNVYSAGVVTDASVSARHAGDAAPVRITAGVDLSNLRFFVPKALAISAGRDIENVIISAQNVNAGDVTQISAGRDLEFTAGGAGGIAVGGPGRVDVLVGRNLDLGLSNGIITTGKLENPNLASASGASLTIFTGFAPGWDVGAFLDKIVVPSNERAEALIAYVEQLAGASTAIGAAKLTLPAGRKLSVDEAVALFLALPAELQRPLVLQQFFAVLAESGRQANQDPVKGYSLGYDAIDALLPGNRGEENPYAGSLSLDFSRIYTLAGGDINLLAPGGTLNVGVAEPPAGVRIKEPGELGIVAQKAGSVHVFTNDDVLVNSSRIFTLLGGDIVIWSTVGDIDAGRGAKSSLSVPPPAVLIDDQGNVTLDLSGAVAGSGIRTIITDSGVDPGDVDLIAPAGFVNAGDAGIGAAGNINIAAKQVLGVDNIQVGGAASGVPAATSGLAASLSGVSAVGGAGDTAAGGTVESSTASQAQDAVPLSEAALSWLEVFVVGLGEDNCRQDDLACLQRQQQ